MLPRLKLANAVYCDVVVHVLPAAMVRPEFAGLDDLEPGRYPACQLHRGAVLHGDDVGPCRGLDVGREKDGYLDRVVWDSYVFSFASCD